MDRRGFLGRLFGGLAAVAVAPALDLFPPVDAAPAAVVAPLSYRNVLDAMVHHAARTMERALPWPSYHSVAEGLIGQSGLTHQSTVLIDDFAVGLFPTLEAVLERVVTPAALTLAEYAKDASAFGRLSINLPGAYHVSRVDAPSGVSVRGVRHYVPMTDQDALRFDVVWGWQCLTPVSPARGAINPK